MGNKTSLRALGFNSISIKGSETIQWGKTCQNNLKNRKNNVKDLNSYFKFSLPKPLNNRRITALTNRT